MTTVRLQIVDAIAAALATATGLAVHRNLDFALEDVNLPALAMVSGDDSPNSEAAMEAIGQDVTIDIAVLIGREANPEAAADPYEAAIHSALMASATFAGHVTRVERAGGSWSFDLGDCAARHLSYRVGFWCDRSNLEI